MKLKLLAALLMLLLLLPAAVGEAVCTPGDLPAEETSESAVVGGRYVLVPAGTQVWADAGRTRCLGRFFAESILYAPDDAAGMTRVVFSMNREIRVGYAASSALRPVSSMTRETFIRWQGITLPDAYLQEADTPQEPARPQTPPVQEASPTDLTDVPATGTDLPATPTDLCRAAATPTDLPQEEEAPSIITQAWQTAAGTVSLKWEKIKGAYSYEILWGGSRRVVNVASLSLTKLPEGPCTITVTPCSDRAGKKPMQEGSTVTVQVVSWDWASPFIARSAVTARQTDPSERVVQLGWTLREDWQPGICTGFEITDGKTKVIASFTLDELTLGQAEAGGIPVTVSTTLPAGALQLYARPYTEPVPGQRVYGSYTYTLTRLTVRVAWQSKKPVLKAAQTDEDVVQLTWTAIDEADLYIITEKTGNVTAVVGETAEQSLTLTGAAYGTHRYQVQPLRFNSLGQRETGALSLQISVTTRVLWSQAPTASVRQTGNDTALLTWVPKVPAERYQVYQLVSGRYVLLRETAATSLQLTAEDGLKPGVTLRYRVCAVKDGKSGTMSIAASLAMVEGWKAAPLLQVEQTGDDSLTLTWYTAGEADFYVIKPVGVLPSRIEVPAESCRKINGVYSYTFTGLKRRSYSFTVQPMQLNGTVKRYGWTSASAKCLVGDYVQPFVLNTQPADAMSCVHGAPLFTVDADGRQPLTYQWQRLLDGEWTDLPGETQASLSAPVEDGFTCRCVITDGYGHAYPSDAASLSLRSCLTITGCSDTLSAFPRDSLELTISTLCDALTCVWETAAAQEDVWEPAGSTDLSLSWPMREEDQGRRFRLQLTDSQGNTALSPELTVTVLPTRATLDGITYTMNADHATARVTGYDQRSRELSLPASVTIGKVDCAVTGIAANAFAGTEELWLTLPGSISLLDDEAFAGVTLLHVSGPQKGYIPERCEALGLLYNQSWLDKPQISGNNDGQSVILSWETPETAAGYRIWGLVNGNRILLDTVGPVRSWRMEADSDAPRQLAVQPIGTVLGTETEGELSDFCYPLSEASPDDADHYHFEYLSDDMWTSSMYKTSRFYRRLVALDMSLYGPINNGAGLIAVARTQLGYHEGNGPRTSDVSALRGESDGTGNFTEYACWYKRCILYGDTNAYAWCAYFVSWCARRADISTSVLPTFGTCTSGMNNLLPRAGAVIHDRELGRSYIPKAGDLIFFKGNGVGQAGHVGIVTGYSNGVVQYLDGNGASRSDDGTSTDHTQVDWRRVDIWHDTVAGYAQIYYQGGAPQIIEPQRALRVVSTTNTSNNMRGADVKWVQQRLKTLGWVNISVDGNYATGTANVVKQFQRSRGLTVTGVVDAATLAALKSDAKVAAPKGIHYIAD